MSVTTFRGYKHTLNRIPDGHLSDWHVLIDEEEYTGNLHVLQLWNAQYGMITMGLDPKGQFVGICINEIGDGGQQTLPFSIINGVLYIGVVPEWRRNHDTVVLNAPRGYMSPKLDRITNAKAELLEEVGVEDQGVVFALPGKPVNPNSAWFVTTDGGGFHYFAVEIPSHDLVRDEEIWVFDDAHEPVQGAGEKIFKCRFIPWYEAMKLEDNFTVAGVGRLMAYLIANGRAEVLKV